MKEQYVSSRLQCDFCEFGKPDWFYPVDSFEQPVDPKHPSFIWGSTGVWAACQTCYEHIENNRREELAIRSVTSFTQLRGKLDPELVQPMYDRIRLLHDEFFAMRSGLPTREYDDAEVPGVTTLEVEDDDDDE